jgi:hypothetical protein
MALQRGKRRNKERRTKRAEGANLAPSGSESTPIKAPAKRTRGRTVKPLAERSFKTPAFMGILCVFGSVLEVYQYFSVTGAAWYSIAYAVFFLLLAAIEFFIASRILRARRRLLPANDEQPRQDT